MSLREVDIALRQINRRNHNNRAFKARFHGVDIPFIERAKPTKEFDEAADRVLSDFMARIVEEKKGLKNG